MLSLEKAEIYNLVETEEAAGCAENLDLGLKIS